MSNITFTVATIAVALTPALPLAASAAAAGPTGATAAETVEDLRAQGYSVQVSGATMNAPLHSCSVNGVREMRGLGASVNSVYVDVSCPLEYAND
ncbi:hypothetical protein [Mycobacterium sp. C31M]